MSGHSKWATTKRRKAAADAKRGKLFTKLVREITIAARMGGGDPEVNARLRTAIANAKACSMPQENIERAIKRGTGELEGTQYEEASYEGYGPGGVALMIEVLTDNRNRATAELRHILSKHGGSLGERGCVSYLFEKKGLIVVEKSDGVDEDELFMLAAEAGAEDMKVEDDRYEIITDVESFHQVREAFESAGIEMVVADLTMIPNTTVRVEGKQAEQVLRLMEALEDSDDVQHVYANFDIPDELLEQAA